MIREGISDKASAKERAKSCLGVFQTGKKCKGLRWECALMYVRNSIDGFLINSCSHKFAVMWRISNRE